MSTAIVTVPATTANLGPGFDCLGAALNVYNQFKFALTQDTAPQAEVKIAVTGVEAEKVSADKDNLAYQSFVKFYQHLGKTPPSVEIEIKLGFPLARGLGSSATAILGGLLGANQLAGNPLTTEEIIKLAIAIEGHPDNVVPALLGNCQLSVAQSNNWQFCQIHWHQDIVPVVAIPDFELSTQQARAVLPVEISRADAIFTLGRIGLLIQGLQNNRGDWLRIAMEDKLHQPYRQKLIRGYEVVKSAALSAGAYGLVISGAGPTLLALTNSPQAPEVASAMQDAWKTQTVTAQVLCLSVDTQGATIK
ncbi:MAG: homoserine kinase [Prochloraceae cyanobacterium]